MNSRHAASLLVSTCCLLSGPVVAQTAAPATIIAPTDKSISYFGRWDQRDPNTPHSHWGGAYLRTRFTGTSVSIQMASGNALVVSIDGEAFRPVKASAGVTQLNLAPLQPLPATHRLLVGSAEGGELLFQGLVLDPGATAQPAAPRPLIEFTGDSITWGSGMDNMWTVNYAWLAAEGLDCDHTQVAQSARALTSGYGCADEKTGMDKQYFMLKNFGYVHDDPQIAWDFSVYTPQIVVINLGQNDACGSEPDDVFTKSYIDFVHNIRAKFPLAQIVALRMFGGDHFGRDTKAAVQVLNGQGDSKVHFVDTEGWLDGDDFRDGVHPNDAGHLKAAMRLAEALRPLLP